MREILFKAKRADDGRWIFGDLIHTCSDKSPLIREHYGRSTVTNTVEKETVCQFTGSEDRYGKMIFEGDILLGFIYDDSGNQVGTEFRVVKYSQKKCAFYLEEYDSFSCININPELWNTLSIVGNIHDDKGRSKNK